jgi:hypothetical protein
MKDLTTAEIEEGRLPATEFGGSYIIQEGDLNTKKSSKKGGVK